MTRTPRALAFALALTSAANVSAQQCDPQTYSPDQRRGPFANFPAGVSLSDESRTTFDPTLLQEAILLTSPATGAAPDTWSGTPGEHFPDYSIDSIFHEFSAAVRATLEIDAMSTGNANLPDFQGGIPLFTANRAWIGLVVSVTADSTPQGLLAYGDGPVGSTLVSHFFCDSGGIVTELVGATQLEQTGSETGFSGEIDLDALDFAMGLVANNPGDATLDGYTAVRNKFYFSLSRSCIAACQAALDVEEIGFTEDQFGEPVAPDAAVVYVSQWLPSASHPSGYAWSAPTVAFSRDALGLTSGVTEDVDAITVSDHNGMLIFSTQPFPERDQLLVPPPTSGLPPLPLKDPHNNRISDLLGIGVTSDVDAACAEDPELGAGQRYPDIAGLPETPYFDNLGAAPHMSLSMARSEIYDPPGTLDAYVYRFRLGGWADFTPVETDDYPVWIYLGTANGFAPIGLMVRSGKQDIFDFEWQVPTGAISGDLRVEALQIIDPNTPVARWSFATTFRY